VTAAVAAAEVAAATLEDEPALSFDAHAEASSANVDAVITIVELCFMSAQCAAGPDPFLTGSRRASGGSQVSVRSW